MNDSAFDHAFVGIVAKLEKTPGDLLSMIDIRSALDNLGLSRQEQDGHIKRLSKAGALVVNPESRPSHRTTEADDAAITVGGTRNHILIWQHRA